MLKSLKVFLLSSVFFCAHVYGQTPNRTLDNINPKTGTPTQEEQDIQFLRKFHRKLLMFKGKDVSKFNAQLFFDPEKFIVRGYSSCNQFFGPFQIKKNEIKFFNLASTMRYCNYENIENEFLDSLESSKLTFDIAEQTFNLYLDSKHIAIFGLIKPNPNSSAK